LKIILVFTDIASVQTESETKHLRNQCIPHLAEIQIIVCVTRELVKHIAAKDQSISDVQESWSIPETADIYSIIDE